MTDQILFWCSEQQFPSVVFIFHLCKNVVLFITMKNMMLGTNLVLLLCLSKLNILDQYCLPFLLKYVFWRNVSVVILLIFFSLLVWIFGKDQLMLLCIFIWCAEIILWESKFPFCPWHIVLVTLKIHWKWFCFLFPISVLILNSNTWQHYFSFVLLRHFQVVKSIRHDFLYTNINL